MTRIRSYITQFQQVFDGEPWLDETFDKKLRPLSEKEAFVRAPDQNHSVAEVVSHLIEWRKEIIRRLKDNSSERLLTEESGNNWKPLQMLQRDGWQNLYTRFLQSQNELLAFLETKDDNFLDQPQGNGGQNNEYFVAGLLHHDLYHLGQIGLILKWARC